MEKTYDLSPLNKMALLRQSTFKEKSLKVVKDLDKQLKTKTMDYLNPHEI